MRGILLAALVAGPVAAAEGPGPEALLGSWTAVEAHRNGAAAPELVGHRLVFADETFNIAAADSSPLYAGRYTVDVGHEPARIDFTNEAGNASGVTWEGIYRLEGDRLTIVDDAPDPAKGRPTDFAAAAGSGYVMIVFQR
jgi:uncharacterized protein (TIGR03067 family)